MTKYFRWDMIVLRSLLLTRRDKGIYAQTWRYPPGSVTYKLYMSYNMFSIIIGHIIHDQQQLPCIDSKCFYEHRLTSTPWIYGGTYLNLHIRWKVMSIYSHVYQNYIYCLINTGTVSYSRYLTIVSWCNIIHLRCMVSYKYCILSTSSLVVVQPCLQRIN